MISFYLYIHYSRISPKFPQHWSKATLAHEHFIHCQTVGGFTITLPPFRFKYPNHSQCSLSAKCCQLNSPCTLWCTMSARFSVFLSCFIGPSHRRTKFSKCTHHNFWSIANCWGGCPWNPQKISIPPNSLSQLLNTKILN